ncbi:glycosyltransferase WbuB [Pseudomonas sp. AU11447]|uniref:glycosyltransferase family 4 protein n=1 Tax=unclassified Pseudomonas TaxID=196821 RepID=UPI0006D44A19|nr:MULTISPECIES: glycosyltransferase family 4 protein [unclassified Pseudomonas]OBY93325.1 glycosyltransferase WbuB [Pseudomonas sp. AU11447]
MKKRILLLSYYFEPDLSAGSFRAEALANALMAEGEGKVEVDVVTTIPNRYHSFNVSSPACEERGALRVRRIAVPAHRSGLVDQALSFLTYARCALRLTRDDHYDLVLATSSRLMTATLGAVIARRARAVLYIDFRDILVDTLPELLPPRYARPATMLFSLVERWTVAQASRINLISPGFKPYFKLRYPKRSFSLHTNGVDEMFHSVSPESSAWVPSGPVQVLYAGNVGTGQGLHHVLPHLAKRLEGEVHFRVVGAGGAHDSLVKALAESGVHNVELLPPMKRSDLLELYARSDVLFLHLNRFRAFRRVLPSKLFEYAATGKPIWAGLSGFPASFTRRKIVNAALFEPCDVEGAIAAFRSLELAPVSRAEFIDSYSRASIKKLMASDVLGTPSSD